MPSVLLSAPYMLPTIDRFRHFYAASAVEGLFYQMVNFLYSAGEIHFKNVFIDGTKMEANANRYSFVWKKVVLNNEAKLLLLCL